MTRSHFLLDSFLTLLLPTVVFVHLLAAPYTKVEESFNIQAVHDILAYGIPTTNSTAFIAANYDHISFPGSVPRSFVGALTLAGTSKFVRQFFTLDPEQVQIAARGVLGFAVAMSLLLYRNAIDEVHGHLAGVLYALVQASQFHVMYYASRTLPNMFAFVLSTVALRFHLLSASQTRSTKSRRRHGRLCIYFLTVAGIIFRAELALLLVFIVLAQLIFTQGSLKNTFEAEILSPGLSGFFVAIAVSIPIDSFFWLTWPQPIWPELVSFIYNSVQGHSSEWGVSPPQFYFADAIPRLLLGPVSPVLILFALTPLAPRPLMHTALFTVGPCLAFVAVYSVLPHKEWRFILPVVPPLTGVAAATAAYVWKGRPTPESGRNGPTRQGRRNMASVDPSEPRIPRLLFKGLFLGSVCVSFAISGMALVLSALNYPGGTAMDRLHELAFAPGSDLVPPAQTTVTVHVGNLAAQTGVTRFLERRRGVSVLGQPPNAITMPIWLYDKTEDAERLIDPAFWAAVDFALVEQPLQLIGLWEPVDAVYAFAGVDLLRPGQRADADEAAADPARAEAHPPGVVSGYRVRAVAKLCDVAATVWDWAEPALREKVARGWWVRVKLRPKVWIMKNRKGHIST
ncbi:Alg9-like mannosyltransferase family-domain-containing protein [Lineolata rhizophorae]|uniref:Mannosyltransferase n=1 Tax=Lineolata rhizophorae TaxID=578093 RepID=A0A6A6P7Y3_9PEZI|nr:Alg9-like mannosyltransferase family-domain-containing protein [Lineolata rhizophorae]